MDYAHKVAGLLLQIEAIKLDVKNPFTWASGIKSPIYCDNRIALSHTYARNIIRKALIEAASGFPAFSVVAGVATAGIPHGVLLADALGLPFVYVRAKAKEHGRQNQIEGTLRQGANVLVVEDLISTGGSSLDAITALKNGGASIGGLLAIFTYQLDQAERRFEKENYDVRTLTNYTTLISIAEQMNYIDQQDLGLLASWRTSPETWQSH